MDDEASNGSSGNNNNNNNNKNLTNDNNNKSPVLGGFLDASKAEKSVWLMKCPSIVSRFLRSQEHEGGDGDASSPPVAKVIVSVDPLKSNDDDNSATEFTMEMAGTGPGDGLKSYSMEMSKDLVDMSVFSESSQGKLSVEGRILNKFDVRPHSENLENYRKICRERTKKYMVKSRQIKVIDNDTGSHMMPMPGMIISGIADKKKLPIKASDMKRTRRDRREMEGIMFKLFEKQPNWTLKQLIQETDQPEQFVKDMLKDLCVYNNKGSNQGSYELKPEYKKSNEEPAPE
ncbi:general transcription factor IIF subunit 2-like [Populus alba x Populus x berolinensis]|nr:general transcription factor IIF subunit 2-like [Populus alba x Populus x berolinensis]